MAEEERIAEELLEAMSKLESATAERILQECSRRLRERRYHDRKPDYPQEWKPDLRSGFEHYVVSNYGFVRHSSKDEDDTLSPHGGHAYPRVFLSPINGGKIVAHMVHELVAESLILCAPIPKTSGKSDKVVNHRDGDKWHPSLDNLEIGTQSDNASHA